MDYRRREMEGGGAKLAGGYRGCLAQVRGDWQFYCQAFGFPQWNEAIRMCPWCQASAVDPDRIWSDFRLTANWRRTLWTHDEYVAHMRRRGLALPMFFKTMGGVLGLRVQNVMVDVLHCVDMGLNSHIVGNVIWWFVVVCSCFGGWDSVRQITTYAS